VVKTLRAPEAIGGWAHIALFERMWGLHAYAAPSHRVETSGGGVYHLDRRGRKCELEGCVAEARAAGGLLLESSFGVYAVEPVAATICGVQVGGVCGEKPQWAPQNC